MIHLVSVSSVSIHTESLEFLRKRTGLRAAWSAAWPDVSSCSIPGFVRQLVSQVLSQAVSGLVGLRCQLREQ